MSSSAINATLDTLEPDIFVPLVRADYVADADDDASTTDDADLAPSRTAHRSTRTTKIRTLLSERRSKIERSMHVARQLLPLQLCVCLMCMLGTSLVCVGGIILGASAGEQLHGWRLTQCRLVPLPNANDTCVYFNVYSLTESDSRSWSGATDAVRANRLACALPTPFAMYDTNQEAAHDTTATSGGGGTVCGANVAHERVEVAHYAEVLARDLERNQVLCLWPRWQTPVTADQCAAATSGTDAWHGLWRSFSERFVFLVRDGNDAQYAVQEATRTQASLGVLLLILGASALLVTMVCAARIAPTALLHCMCPCVAWARQCQSNRQARVRSAAHLD